MPWDKNPKIKELEAILPSIEGKIIIWAKYHFEMDILKRFFENTYGEGSVALFHGRVPQSERAGNITRWKTDPNCRFLVSNQQMGGVGNTWNEASTTIYFSNTFKYIDRIQSEDRNHRIGQKNSVLYVDLVMDGTVEQVIMQSVETKKDVADFILKCIEKGDAKSLGDIMV